MEHQTKYGKIQYLSIKKWIWQYANQGICNFKFWYRSSISFPPHSTPHAFSNRSMQCMEHEHERGNRTDYMDYNRNDTSNNLGHQSSDFHFWLFMSSRFKSHCIWLWSSSHMTLHRFLKNVINCLFGLFNNQIDWKKYRLSNQLKWKWFNRHYKKENEKLYDYNKIHPLNDLKLQFRMSWRIITTRWSFHPTNEDQNERLRLDTLTQVYFFIWTNCYV